MKLDQEQIMKFMYSAPANIFFKDTECKYCFSSEICDLVMTGENGTIISKTDLEIQPNKEYGKVYYEDDKKILATGIGSEYINEFPLDNGESLYFEIKKSAVKDDDNSIIGIVGIVSDVTERVRMEKQLEEFSITDSLTGVYNRNYLKYRIDEKIKELEYPFSVIMSDCNNLKLTNDKYGHEYGDIMLRIMASTLKEVLPKDFPIIRMGGDEFLVLCNGTSKEEVEGIMNAIRKCLKDKSKEKIPLSLAMGSYTVESGDFKIEDVCREADKQMYLDKYKGKNDDK